MNYSRKSTVGWNIDNVVLDFTGGSLSVAQLLLDGWLTNSWSGVSGDPVKFALGNLSMFYDVVFLVQHFCLYTSRADTDSSSYQRVAGESSSAGEPQPEKLPWRVGQSSGSQAF